ncbi:isochorismatase family protein [Cohnella suwonensis]|uniref:Isochorismatase family protein n=1 Tax=Cohnella suwonensis TaxID=696072 RepID=A0ABW0LTE4_9BACL
MTTNTLTAENTAMILIDHQIGTMGWVRSISFEEMKQNALVLAKSAKAIGMPVLLTSSLESQAQGPLLEELKTILPEEYESRIQRVGVVNAMDDPNFANAVKKLGRKNLIIAGVTNDVCTVFPALSAVKDGYNVQVVADAGGSPTKFADEIALRRMEANGVTLTSTNQLIAELAKDWTTEDGAKLIQIMFVDILSKL